MARPKAKDAETVVLPTPPLPEVMQTTRPRSLFPSSTEDGCDNIYRLLSVVIAVDNARILGSLLLSKERLKPKEDEIGAIIIVFNASLLEPYCTTTSKITASIGQDFELD